MSLGSFDQKPEIDIVDEELARIEFESLNKSTHIGSVVVPPLRLPLPRAQNVIKPIVKQEIITEQKPIENDKRTQSKSPESHNPLEYE